MKDETVGSVGQHGAVSSESAGWLSCGWSCVCDPLFSSSSSWWFQFSSSLSSRVTSSAHLYLLLIGFALFLRFSIRFHLCFGCLTSVSKVWDIGSTLKRISGSVHVWHVHVCLSVRVHVCHCVHVEVRGHCQVLVFTLYLVWGRVSSPYGLHQAHQPWSSRDSVSPAPILLRV